MGIFNFINRSKKDKEILRGKESLEEKLSKCDFILVAESFELMFEQAKLEGEAKGGSYVIDKGLMDAMTIFINKPCLDTAITLVNKYPFLSKSFERP